MPVYSPPEGHRKILALDGGGIRGIIPVMCLVTFEQLAGKPCHEFFDMIAGTSVGAIIAGLLAVGKSAFEVFSLFEDHHEEFFTSNGLFSSFLNPPKYSKEPIRELLYTTLGDRRLADCKTDILLTATDTVADETTFFSAFHHAAGTTYGTYKDCLLRKVMEASMSAPLYFSPYRWFIDGGVGSYNNPCLQAAIEALCYSHDDPAQIRYKRDQVTVYSFGTGRDFDNLQPDEAKDLPGLDVVGWARWVIGEGMDAANDQQVNLIGNLTLRKAGLTFPVEIKRFDLSLIESSMRKIGLLNVTEEDLRGLALDAVERYRLLREIGSHLAAYITQQHPPFSESTLEALMYRTPSVYQEAVRRVMS